MNKMNVLALKDDRNLRQFVKFVMVGTLTTGINFLVYSVLVLAGVHYLLAAVIAFLLATLNSYTLNRTWTFRAGAHRHSRLAKFTMVQVIGLSINLVALVLLVEYGGFQDHKLLAQLLANACVVASNFLGNKFWTFRGDIDLHLR